MYHLIMQENETRIINYTKESFLPIFNTIKDCIRFDRYSIELNKNRQENIDFITEFNIKNERIKKILNDIKIEDFCYATPHISQPNVLLYVFSPIAKVWEIADICINVQMYIKFRILEKIKPNALVTISFHKLNREISYLFK